MTSAFSKERETGNSLVGSKLKAKPEERPASQDALKELINDETKLVIRTSSVIEGL